MKHSAAFSGFLFLILSLIACGGSPGTTPTPQTNPSDKTAPTLVSSLPETGASAVPINAKLAFTFSETMDKASLELTANPAITLGTAVWNPDSTSVAFANEALAASTAYRLTLKAKDTSGNPLEETLTFTTSDMADTTAPSTPTGLVATPNNAQVTLTWQANAEPDVVGYTLYMGTSQDALESKGFITTNSKTFTNLTNGTSYFFAVDAVDSAGNASAKTTPVSATPSTTVNDNTPPRLQSSDPADGATDADSSNSRIQLVFSEPMDTASLTLALVVDPCLGPATGCTKPTPNVIWSEADTVATVTLEPPNELKEKTTYKLTLSAKDKASNALSGDAEIIFLTADLPPQLVSSTPADGATNLPATETTITFTFSEPINPTYFLWESHPPLACNSGEFLTDQTTFLANGCQLKGSRTYRLSFAAITQAGESLSANLSFSTVADETPPRVLETSPLTQATNVGLNTMIRIAFDNTMDKVSTLAALSSSAPLGCTWTFNEEKDTLLCSPANLVGNTTYTVTVNTSAKDIAGKNLALPPRTSCIIDLPCGYSFSFSTVAVATTGTLRVNVSGLPTGQNRVRVTGPNGYSSGAFGSSQTLTDLAPGSYTITAQGFGTGQPNKPTCKIYTPSVASQTRTVTAGQSATATVTYQVEPCELLDP